MVGVGEVRCPRCGFVFTGVKSNKNIFCNCGWKRIVGKILDNDPDLMQTRLE